MESIKRFVLVSNSILELRVKIFLTCMLAKAFMMPSLKELAQNFGEQTLQKIGLKEKKAKGAASIIQKESVTLS